MAKLLKPYRGTKQKATINNILLSDGELFCAYNASTNGNDAGQIYIGDGATSFSSLKPFIQDPSLSSSTFTSSINGSVPASGGGTTKYLRADGTWQAPPDTKVTAVGNHYTPTTNNASSLSASATGATAAWSIDVVKGVTIKRDAKGHVTGLEVTSGKIPAKPTYTAADVGALSLNGGTMDGSIIMPPINDIGIIPKVHNHGQIGSSSNYFLRGYFTSIYGQNINVRNNLSTVSINTNDIVNSDTWDNTNTSLKTAVTNKLSKSGGTISGDLEIVYNNSTNSSRASITSSDAGTEINIVKDQQEANLDHSRLLLYDSTSGYNSRIDYDQLQFNNSSYSLQIATPELNKNWDIIKSDGWNNSFWKSLNSYLGGIGGTFWTKGWTATSTNTANAKLSDSVDISPGNYLLIGSSPGTVSAELPIAITTNANLNIFPLYVNIKSRTHFIFHIQATASVSNVYLKTASSASITYSNIDQGGFRLIKLG